MTNADSSMGAVGETSLAVLANEPFELDRDPLAPLLHALENSPELQPYVKKVGARKIAEVVLNVALFAPHDPDDTSDTHTRLIKTLGFYLEDGTPVSASFDFGAFNFVCIDTLSDELSPGESRGLFEAMKNTQLLGRVYKGPQQDHLLSVIDDASKPEQQVDLTDTGRAVIPIRVHEILNQYWAFLTHHENAANYEDYVTMYTKARQLLPDAFRVDALDQKERGVYMFLREKSSQLIHFFQITEWNLRSGEPLTEVACYHGLTQAGGTYPDTFDSLVDIIEHGFASQKIVSRREGPNASIGRTDEADQFAEKSARTGDAYTLIIHGAKVAQTGQSARLGERAPAVSDPVIKRPGLNLVFIDQAPNDRLSVIIHANEQTREANEQLYKELFAKIAPEMEFSFNYR